jgi:hypothetical protein
MTVLTAILDVRFSHDFSTSEVTQGRFCRAELASSNCEERLLRWPLSLPEES